jgi:nitrite reductase (NO-forming)
MKTALVLLTITASLSIMSAFTLQIEKQPFDLKASIERGKDVYTANCQNCHMENGEGMPDVFPPLAKSEYLKKDAKILINTVLKGLEGEIVVNGKKYNSLMPAQDYLSDEQVSDVFNYVRNSWGSKAAAILPAQVKALR